MRKTIPTINQPFTEKKDRLLTTNDTMRSALNISDDIEVCFICRSYSSTAPVVVIQRPGTRWTGRSWGGQVRLCKQRYISELLFDLQIGGRCYPPRSSPRLRAPLADQNTGWMDGRQFFNSRRARRTDAK